MQSIIIILVISSLIGISVITFTSVWVILEINTIAMCFIMSKLNKINNINNENTIKYFLVQAIASAFIMLLVTSHNSSNFWEIGIAVILIVNIGVWPSHLWYLNILNSIDINSESILIMITWQNVIPLVLINNISISEKTNIIIVFVSLMSILIPITQLNNIIENNIVIAISSVNTNGWLLMLTILENANIIIFLIVYTPSLSSALNELSNNENNENNLINNSMSTTINIANLSGIPPLPLFWGKLILIISLIENNIQPLVIIGILTIACGITFFYTHISLPSLLSTNNKTNI